MCVCGAGDVLDVDRTKVLRADGELSDQLLEHTVGHANPVRWRRRLEPRRDIDAVTEQVVVLDGDVPEVDADAHADALLVGERQVEGPHQFLELDGATHGLDRAGKLGQQSVAHSLEQASIVARQQRPHHLDSLLQHFQRDVLGDRDHAAVADHIGCEDCRQPTPNGLLIHRARSFPILPRDRGPRPHMTISACLRLFFTLAESRAR